MNFMLYNILYVAQPWASVLGSWFEDWAEVVCIYPGRYRGVRWLSHPDDAKHSQSGTGKI